MKALLILVASLGLTTLAVAKQPVPEDNQKINGTIIVRQNPKTGKVEKLHVGSVPHSEAEAKALIKKGKFKEIPESNVAVGELDREGGVSSWYWHSRRNHNYNNYYSYPSYYNYGYTYYPYYYCNNYGYNYYYYSYSYYQYQPANWWY